MNTANEIRSWASKLKNACRLPDVIEFCDAVIEYVGKRKTKSEAEKKRSRAIYMRKYMADRRKMQKTEPKPADMGDFSEE